jgi:hypothetical protein
LIGTTTTNPNSAYPRGPFGVSQCDAVHNAGEIWSSALWEVRALMIARLGFTLGTERVLQVVTDGMKLAPTGPTFLQERDAIISAASSFSQADVDDVREGFRRRGMGFNAKHPVDVTGGRHREFRSMAGRTDSNADADTNGHANADANRNADSDSNSGTRCYGQRICYQGNQWSWLERGDGYPLPGTGRPDRDDHNKWHRKLLVLECGDGLLVYDHAICKPLHIHSVVTDDSRQCNSERCELYRYAVEKVDSLHSTPGG